MNWFGDLGVFGGCAADATDRVTRNGTGGIRIWKEVGLGFKLQPILTQDVDQTRGEHDGAVLSSFTLADTDHHA
jgi:hypothetical protein